MAQNLLSKLKAPGRFDPILRHGPTHYRTHRPVILGRRRSLRHESPDGVNREFVEGLGRRPDRVEGDHREDNRGVPLDLDESLLA